MLRAAGGDEVQGDMRRPADVFMRKGPIGTLVTATHHALTDKTGSAHHKHQQDNGDDWTNGVGGFITRKEA